MRTIKYPVREEWEGLCARPEIKREDLEKVVGKIIEEVKNEGDEAIFKYSRMFDSIELTDLKVTAKEIEKAASMVDKELKESIALAKSNIEKFHSSGITDEGATETVPGVVCWRENVAIQKVGLYIPGGSAPLFSTVLMLAVPATIAGCGEIILCTPPMKDGSVNPIVLYAASISGITRIFKVGGAQAIAAMALGTATIPKVFKIFGPGNQYVTKAKEMVRLMGTEIDMPAGPSEVLVIADKDADPAFVAADLLSQAEHGADSQVVLVTDSPMFAEKVGVETEIQLGNLPRRDIASKALANSLFIVLKSLDDCMEFSNYYAPEHLIISTSDPRYLAKKVVNAGSVFLGKYSCESVGDYASGTNHTLPTNRYARVSGGVAIESFMKKITFQELTPEGIKNIGPAVEKMAEAEGLRAHKNAVTIRLASLEKE
jgi:histidinol dehydrogenase